MQPPHALALHQQGQGFQQVGGAAGFRCGLGYDLAAVLAVASSFRDRVVPNDLAAIGEVGLTGELRAVSALGQRLSEVRRLGFTKCLIPKRVQGRLTPP